MTSPVWTSPSESCWRGPPRSSSVSAAVDSLAAASAPAGDVHRPAHVRVVYSARAVALDDEIAGNVVHPDAAGGVTDPYAVACAADLDFARSVGDVHQAADVA